MHATPEHPLMSWDSWASSNATRVEKKMMHANDVMQLLSILWCNSCRKKMMHANDVLQLLSILWCPSNACRSFFGCYCFSELRDFVVARSWSAMHTEKTTLPFLLSNWMGGYDRGDSFPFDFQPNAIPFSWKSKGKLSPRSYPIQFERK